MSTEYNNRRPRKVGRSNKKRTKTKIGAIVSLVLVLLGVGNEVIPGDVLDDVFGSLLGEEASYDSGEGNHKTYNKTDNQINEESKETHSGIEEIVEFTVNNTGASDLMSLPSYTGEPFISVNNNEPTFTEGEITATSYESYSYLDDLGRVGVAKACIGMDLMPTIERGSISEVYPTGWEQEKYDNVDGSWIYNRSHLIGWQLTGEDANEYNLLTGTRYMNVEGMLPFENMVADYIKETKNHVMYRVTPHFVEDNLLASGVQMEAYSVEDAGEGISFNVYCYNVQPDITIDYTTGVNHAS